MKFNTMTLLFALIACTLANSAQEDFWCGSSVVSVSITSAEGVTKAKLLVPVSLKKSSSHVSLDTKSNIEKFNSGTLIKKSQQGIVFTLDGPVNTAQLGKIYEIDEDSQDQVYIPYAFFTDMIPSATPTHNPTKYTIDLFFKKDFKKKLFNDTELRKVTITFLADKYETLICQCMFEYLVAKIKFNWNLRRLSLDYVRSQLFLHIRNIHANYKAIKTIQGSAVDLKLVETLKIEKKTQTTKCDDAKTTLDITVATNVEVSKKMESLEDPDCERFDNELILVGKNLEEFNASVDPNISAAKARLTLSQDIGKLEIDNKILEQRTIITKMISDAVPFVKDLEPKQTTSFTAKKAEFDAIELVYAKKAVNVEITHLETENTKVANIKTYFEGGFWKTD